MQPVVPVINSRDIEKISHLSIARFTIKNERKILKAFFLARIHQLLCEQFKNKIQSDLIHFPKECYAMDSKIIQLLIQNLVESGEYTLEGIALYTHIPLDVIYDAACGVKNQFSITPWVRLVDLYMQVNPDIEQALMNKLIEIKSKNRLTFNSIMAEK